MMKKGKNEKVQYMNITSYCTKLFESFKFISSFGPGVSTVAIAKHLRVSWPEIKDNINNNT